MKVKVQRVEVVSFQIDIRAQGEIRPRRRTALSAEVGGRLVRVAENFEAGETFEEGALLLQIDRADYDAAHAAAEASLAEAKLALEMEKVRKAQALRDWTKLGLEGEPSVLVRRVPHLLSAEAKVAAAQAAVDKAVHDCERTELRTPFACRIERTYVDVGAVVSPGMPAADLVSLGPVEVRLPLSLEDYGYLQRTKAGRVTGGVQARGRIGGRERSWDGNLVRSEEIVESTTRSINVVAEFGRNGGEAPPIGMFIEADISGISLPEVVEVPRTAVRRGSEVLLVDQNDALQFRKVEV
ncbi:MAG: efflux RND transporter periplasmic adaptor subunit, partial [Akkermansiaceae bacterium]|nr:efflux RND transporter periplasmic adaptor subunit [Akkermansiaceae bacterium]